jgi:hypothetical protein
MGRIQFCESFSLYSKRNYHNSKIETKGKENNDIEEKTCVSLRKKIYMKKTDIIVLMDRESLTLQS